METDTVTSDKGLGLAVTFSLLSVLAAAAMLGTGLVHFQLAAAWSFAAAMVAGVLAILAIHLYW